MTLTIALVQINSAYQIYLPYSVGLLQSYVQHNAQQPEKYQFLMPIYTLNESIEEAVLKIQAADIVGFSSYIWNMNKNLALAKRLKELNPEIFIVFGGPQVPDHCEDFLREHPFINMCCHGEGEAIFLQLLESYPNLNREIAGTSYLDNQKQFITHPKGPRIKDVNTIPSPYLSGVFDELIENNPGESWFIMWETNRGCPFACTFCDWGSAINSKIYPFEIERLYQELDWFAKHQVEFVFCCDANFGILKRDLELAKYMVKVKEETNYPGILNFQSTKNLTERAYEIPKMLYACGLYPEVTLSLQSVDPNTLKHIKRDNISLETYEELQRRFTRDGVKTYTELILGLPGETYQSYTQGIDKIISNGQHHNLKYHNLALLPNAEMNTPEARQLYGFETQWIEMVYARETIHPPSYHIPEYHEVVIATKSLPCKDWLKARTFGLMSSFLYFNMRLLQIPLIFIHHFHNISHSQLIEWFIEQPLLDKPVLKEVLELFQNKSRAIQNGEPEYYRGEAWSPVWWFIDEFIIARLFVELKLEDLYRESHQHLKEFLDVNQLQLDPKVLEDSITLSQAMFEVHHKKAVQVPLQYNSWEFYISLLKGQPIKLEKHPHQQSLLFEDLP